MMPEEKQQPASSEHPSLSTSMLLQVQQMHPEAWTRLVETFGPIIYQWCRQSGVEAHDSADLVQDIFAKVARGISGFQRQKSTGSFRSWLATITRNRIRDYFRRDRVKHPEAVGGTNLQIKLNHVPDHLEQSLTEISETNLEKQLPSQLLQRVRSEVEPKTWQAFWLTAVEDKSADDVAIQLDMKLASVYQARSRVLRRLRTRLGELPK